MIALFFADAGKFCAGEHQTGAIDNRTVHHLAVQGNHAEAFASGGFSGFYDAAGVIHFFLGRCVEVVQQINLTRVDQRFAVKAQLFDVGGFLQESGFVISVGIDGIRTFSSRGDMSMGTAAAGSNMTFSPSRNGTSLDLQAGLEARVRENITLGVQAGYAHSVSGSSAEGYNGQATLNVTF